MEKWLRAKNTVLVENDIPSDFGVMKAREALSKPLEIVDDCDEYNGFLDEMQVLMDKVSVDDLSDFEEF